MRHLYLTGRGSTPRELRSSAARAMTIVRAAILTTLVVAAMPLRAQKTATRAASRAPSHAASRAPSHAASHTSPQASQAAAPAASHAASPGASTPSNDSYNVTASTVLSAAPASDTIGSMRKGTNVEVIARDHGWTRVRVEGWVPDSILTPADTTYRAGLSAADLRADPAAARGKMVVWNVEFLALQTADPLRHGLADGEPYILARGPNSENALLYLVVPPSLIGTARALQPLATITVIARVRDGRSDPVGIPILDIQTIRRIR